MTDSILDTLANENKSDIKPKDQEEKEITEGKGDFDKNKEALLPARAERVVDTTTAEILSGLTENTAFTKALFRRAQLILGFAPKLLSNRDLVMLISLTDSAVRAGDRNFFFIGRYVSALIGISYIIDHINSTLAVATLGVTSVYKWKMWAKNNNLIKTIEMDKKKFKRLKVSGTRKIWNNMMDFSSTFIASAKELKFGSKVIDMTPKELSTTKKAFHLFGYAVAIFGALSVAEDWVQRSLSKMITGSLNFGHYIAFLNEARSRGLIKEVDRLQYIHNLEVAYRVSLDDQSALEYCLSTFRRFTEWLIGLAPDSMTADEAIDQTLYYQLKDGKEIEGSLFDIDPTFLEPTEADPVAVKQALAPFMNARPIENSND